MKQADFQLRERIKELKCLYDLSRISWEAGNDVDALAEKTLGILPSAMQFPALAEAAVVIDGQLTATNRFRYAGTRLSFSLVVASKKRGEVTLGYRPSRGEPVAFLAEEKKLLRAVARELSLILKRIDAEKEKEKLQQQFRHVERLAFVGELSAGIAHELNEPLGRILGFAQLIKKAGGLNGQQSEDMERIIKASLYTREIIKKLMIFSRQMPQQITAVDLNEVIGNILYFIDARFVSRQITITQELTPSLPRVQADEVQLGQVLVNLLTNAIHAMPDGGQVTVTTKPKPGGVVLSVRDTGQGMSADVRKKIFEPFFTTKGVGEGTGLGMSVVQGIIIAHNGEIQVSSRPGKGTKVEISLPLKQAARRKKKS